MLENSNMHVQIFENATNVKMHVTDVTDDNMKFLHVNVNMRFFSEHEFSEKISC
jgi:hypothetical protein